MDTSDPALTSAYLSGRTLSVVSLWMLIGVASILAPALHGPFLGLGVILMALAIRDRSSGKALEALAAEIDLPQRIELEKTEKLKVTFSGTGIPSKLSVSCALPPQLHSTLERVPVTGSEACIEVRGKQLGRAQLSSCRAHLVSPLGLWLFERQISSKDVNTTVFPPLIAMPEHAYRTMASRHRQLSRGLRVLARNTSPDQYLTSRPYLYPDPIRFLDHRKTAKFGTPFTRVFDSLHEHHIVVALDLGRAVLGTIGTSTKFDYYRSAALWTIQHALELGDSASFIGFCDKGEVVIPRSRSMANFEPLRSSPQIQARDRASNFAALYGAIQRVAPQRSIIVIFTDAELPSIQEQLSLYLPRIARKHLCLAVGMLEDALTVEKGVVNSPARLSERHYFDLLYTYWIHDSFTQFSRSLAHTGADAILVPESYWMNTCARIYEEIRTSQHV